MTKQNTQVRRRQIIEAARNLIASKGMEGVTIDAIAAAVGLSEGAIYRHFASKQQILLHLIEEIERNLLDMVGEAQLGGGPPLEKLERIMVAHLTYTDSERAVSFIVIAEAIAFEGIGLRSRVSAMLQRYVDSIQQVLQQGVGEGSLPPDLDVEAAAATFLALIQSTAVFRALADYTWSMAEWRSRVWHIYVAGLGAAAGPRRVPMSRDSDSTGRPPARTSGGSGTATFTSSG